jgi:hypothetical protein
MKERKRDMTRKMAGNSRKSKGASSLPAKALGSSEAGNVRGGKGSKSSGKQQKYLEFKLNEVFVSNINLS